MNGEMFKALVVETVTKPAMAARRVIDLGYDTGTLWTGLVLVSVLNGIFYGILLPGAAAQGLILPDLAASPVMLAIFIGVALTITVQFLVMTGRVLGGSGDLRTILNIMVWLQLLRLGLQLAITVISLVIPVLGSLVALVAGFWGLWVLANFIAVAHGIDVLKSVGVMVMTFFGIIVVLSVLMAVLGFGVPAGGI